MEKRVVSRKGYWRQVGGKRIWVPEGQTTVFQGSSVDTLAKAAELRGGVGLLVEESQDFPEQPNVLLAPPALTFSEKMLRRAEMWGAGNDMRSSQQVVLDLIQFLGDKNNSLLEKAERIIFDAHLLRYKKNRQNESLQGKENTTRTPLANLNIPPPRLDITKENSSLSSHIREEKVSPGTMKEKLQKQIDDVISGKNKIGPNLEELEDTSVAVSILESAPDITKGATIDLAINRNPSTRKLTKLGETRDGIQRTLNIISNKNEANMLFSNEFGSHTEAISSIAQQIVLNNDETTDRIMNATLTNKTTYQDFADTELTEAADRLIPHVAALMQERYGEQGIEEAREIAQRYAPQPYDPKYLGSNHTSLRGVLKRISSGQQEISSSDLRETFERLMIAKYGEARAKDSARQRKG